jgi:hypothetical protein
LADCFKNVAFQIAHSIESLLTEMINTGAECRPGARGAEKQHLTCYGNDIDESRLWLQLSMLSDLCCIVTLPMSLTKISDVKLFID